MDLTDIIGVVYELQKEAGRGYTELPHKNIGWRMAGSSVGEARNKAENRNAAGLSQNPVVRWGQKHYRANRIVGQIRSDTARTKEVQGDLRSRRKTGADAANYFKEHRTRPNFTFKPTPAAQAHETKRQGMKVGPVGATNRLLGFPAPTSRQ